MSLLLNNLQTHHFKSFSHEPLFDKGYLVITDPSANILYATCGIEQRKGFSVEEILGEKPGKLWGGHMAPGLYKQMWSTIQGKKQPFAAQMKNTKKDGSAIVEYIHIIPVFNKAGCLKYYLEIQPDIANSYEERAFQKDFFGECNSQKPVPQSMIKSLYNWLSTKDYSKLPISSRIDDFSEILDKLFLSSHSLEIIKDKKLIAAAKINYEEFGDIYRKYKDVIFHYFYYRLNRDIEIAEDLTQDTFIRSFRALAHYGFQNYTYLSYLFVVARHLLINYYRARKFLPLEEKYINVDILKTEEQLVQTTQVHIIWRAVKSLSPREQEILRMKYRDDLSIKDIAQKQARSPNAIKLMLSRARKKLKKSLQ